jgi:O-antigen/teichoic acid export membrane protein
LTIREHRDGSPDQEGHRAAAPVAAPIPNPEPTLARRIAFKSLGGILALPLNMALQLMVPRALGAARYGDYAFLSAFFTALVNFGDAGTSQAFYSKVSKRPGEPGIYGFYARLGLGILALLLAFIAIARLAGFGDNFWPNLALDLILLAALMAFGNWVISILTRSVDANAMTTRGEAVTLAVRALLVAAVAAFFFSRLLTVKVFFGLQNVLNLVLIGGLLAVLARGGRARYFTRQVPRDELRAYGREFWAYSHPLLTIAFVALIAELLDRWMLQKFGGSRQQGYLGMGLQIASVVFTFGAALPSLLAREFARSHQERDDDRLRAQFSWFAPRAYAITAFFGVFLAVEAPLIVRLFGGEEFALAAPATAILCFYPLHQVYGQLANALLYATDRTTTVRTLGLISLSLGLVMTYVMIAPARLGGLGLGAIGLAAKMVIHQVIIVNLVILANARFLRLPFGPLLLKQITAPMLFAACAFAGYTVAESVTRNLVVSFILAGIVYCVLVAAVAWFVPQGIGFARGDLTDAVARFRRSRALPGAT